MVLVQLNDIYYNMGVIRRYLNEGHTDLAPLAYRMLSMLREVYYTKMIKTDLSYNDWKKYTRVLNVREKSESLMNLKSGWAGRVLMMLKTLVGHSYLGYLFVRFLYHEFFLRFFFEKLHKKV